MKKGRGWTEERQRPPTSQPPAPPSATPCPPLTAPTVTSRPVPRELPSFPSSQLDITVLRHSLSPPSSSRRCVRRSRLGPTRRPCYLPPSSPAVPGERVDRSIQSNKHIYHSPFVGIYFYMSIFFDEKKTYGAFL